MSSSRQQSAQKLFADYDANHRTVGNRVTHYLGIPLIVFSALGLLARVSLVHLPLSAQGFDLDLGQILLIFAAIFYVYLAPGIGLLFSVLLVVAYAVARIVPMAPLWIAFFAGWILQFVGHSHYEKRRPAFFNNLTHLMVGPLWIFAKAIGKSLKAPKESTLT